MPKRCGLIFKSYVITTTTTTTSFAITMTTTPHQTLLPYSNSLVFKVFTVHTTSPRTSICQDYSIQSYPLSIKLLPFVIHFVILLHFIITFYSGVLYNDINIPTELAGIYNSCY